MRKSIALLTVMLAVLLTGCGESSQPVTTDGAGLPEQNQDTARDSEAGDGENGYDFRAPETVTQDAESSDTERESPDVNASEDFNSVQKPMIALTFDDGPSRHTEHILDLLERYGGQATFFVLGSRIEEWRDTIARAAAAGSEVAGHTWSHRALTRLSERQIKGEIQKTSEAIEDITGVARRFYRPPYGSIDKRVKSISADLGYALVLWTVDIRDWKYRCADAVYDAVMSSARENAVILLHDIHATTAQAMERVIPGLIAEGYRLVTVSELLYHLYGELEQGKVYGRRS